MPMPGLLPSPSPSRYLTTSSPCLQSKRWEGVFYSVRFTFLRLSSLALGTFPEEWDFSLKIAGVYHRWTRHHWNRRLSTLADNPDFSLFSLLWWCSGFPSFILISLIDLWDDPEIRWSPSNHQLLSITIDLHVLSLVHAHLCFAVPYST